MPRQKIVLIGAGSLQFGLGTVGSILESEILQGSTICLHDINAELLKLSNQACESAIQERELNFELQSTTNRIEALKGANFIINAIEVPPRFKLLDMDYTIPLQYGNKQVTGENGGPGGLFHSLRVIPPILDICSDIQKICPNAFFINYSNPMSRICLAIKRKFPSLKFAGLCHEFQHFMVLVEKILATPLSHLEVIGGGLNHFGIILDIKYKNSGEDAYPDLRKKGLPFLNSINAYDGFKLVAFILDTYGYCPYTTDSHYGEYLHWAWEKADIPAIRKFWESYEDMLARGFISLKKKIQKGKGSKLVKPDEECGISIIEGILTDRNYVEPSVNVPNDGVFTNLPQDAVVECPAKVNKEGVKGLKLGEYPKTIASLIQTQYSVQDLVVEAIIQESRNLALSALLADPVIDSYWQAKSILKRLLELQDKYLQIKLK
jgi:alpha-galactosidase